MFGKISPKAVQREVAVGKGFYPTVPDSEKNTRIELIIHAKSEQALLPISDEIIAPPLVLGVNAEVLRQLECTEVIVPAYSAVRIQAIILPKDHSRTKQHHSRYQNLDYRVHADTLLRNYCSDSSNCGALMSIHAAEQRLSVGEHY